MKVSELTGAQLDYWVGVALGDRLVRLLRADGDRIRTDRCEARFGEQWDWRLFMPSSAWMDGGPILERALISVLHNPVDSPGAPGYWSAFIRSSDDDSIDGPTYLVAAMRAYVASKFGPEVQP